MKKGWKKMTREELIRDEDYTEEEAEKMVLQKQLNNANERIEELESLIQQAIKILSGDLSEF